MEEGRYDGVAHVVVLAVGVEPRRRAEGRIRGGRPRIAQSSCGADDGNRRERREAQGDAQRNVDRRDDRKGRERRAYPHCDDEPHQEHGECGHRPIVREHLGDVGHEGFDVASGLHYRGEALGRNHDEPDDGHHLHPLGEDVVGVAPGHRTGDEEDHQPHERSDEQTVRFGSGRLHPQLHPEARNDSDERHDDGIGGRASLPLFFRPVRIAARATGAALAEQTCQTAPARTGFARAARTGLAAGGAAVRAVVGDDRVQFGNAAADGLRSVDRNVGVFAGLSIGEEDGDEEAGDHSQRGNPHGRHHVDAVGPHSGFADVAKKNVIEEDAAESDRQIHVGGHQAEGQDAGHEPPVDPQFVHDRQKRRNEQRDECDVHGNEILAHDRHGENPAEHRVLHDGQHAFARRVFLADPRDERIGKKFGKPRVGHGHREGAEEGVGEGDLRPAREPLLKGDQRSVQAEAA